MDAHYDSCIVGRRVGGATKLLASGVASNPLETQGGYMCDARKVYARNHGRDAGCESEMLANVDCDQEKSQLGLGTQ